MTITNPDNLPAVPDAPTGVLALPTEDEWAGVDDGFVGEQTIEPTVPMLTFNANFGYGFEDELTGRKIGAGETLRAVWLAHRESRAFWIKKFGEGDTATPDCRSANMIQPDPDVPAMQSPTCASCPNSKWTAEGAPACRVSENVMLYLPDEQRITRTSFAGIGIKHVQRFLGGFDTRVPRRPPMAFITEITPTVETTKYGDKLAPHFRLGEPITRAEAEPLITLRDRLMAQWQELIERDLAESRNTDERPQQQGDPFAPRDDEVPFGEDDIVDAEIVDEAVPYVPTAPLPEEEDF